MFPPGSNEAGEGRREFEYNQLNKCLGMFKASLLAASNYDRVRTADCPLVLSSGEAALKTQRPNSSKRLPQKACAGNGVVSENKQQCAGLHCHQQDPGEVQARRRSGAACSRSPGWEEKTRTQLPSTCAQPPPFQSQRYGKAVLPLSKTRVPAPKLKTRGLETKLQLGIQTHPPPFPHPIVQSHFYSRVFLPVLDFAVFRQAQRARNEDGNFTSGSLRISRLPGGRPDP